MLKIKEDKTIRENHLNEIRPNKKGTLMKIIRYKLTSDMDVEFQDEYKYVTKATYQNFKIGQIKNPYDKSIYGIGYLGVGKHLSHNGRISTKQYDIWQSIIQRCYIKNVKYLPYADCTVCDEWLNFQTFADWYEENYYNIGEGRMHIDKDILVNGNKIYSPDKCIIVPQRINMIFMKKHRDTNSDLPTGINRTANGFSAMYNTKSLGIYKTVDEAITVYGVEKRIHIKQVVEEYGDRLPPKIREILLNW